VLIHVILMVTMYFYSVGGTTRQESSTVRSRRNPISKPMRHPSGKLQDSVSKVALISESVVDCDSGSAALISGKTGHRTEGGKNRKVDSSLHQWPDTVDANNVLANGTVVFYTPLAERVKLRRMSQLGDVHVSSPGDGADAAKLTRSAAEKARLAGTPMSVDDVAKTTKKSNSNNKSSKVYIRMRPGSVKLATTKKNSAIRNTVKLSKSRAICAPKLTRLGEQRSVQKRQEESRLTACSRPAANSLKQASKAASVVQKVKQEITVSKASLAAALRSKQKSAASNAVQPKSSCNLVKEPVSSEIAEKMPRLKANKKQFASMIREKKSMPVLQQETFAESNRSTKKSPRKRQQHMCAANVGSKSPKLLSEEEASCVAERRGSLRSKAAASCGDDEMPQLLVVEMMQKAEPLTVTVDQFECPPELDRSPSRDAAETVSAEQKTPISQLPVPSLCDNKDSFVATSPRCVDTVAEHAENTAKNSAPKHSPARSKHHANQMPVSNRTALSQNNCSISSPIAVTQTEYGLSMDCCDSPPMVAMTTHTDCSTSLQLCTTPLKQTGSDFGSLAETQPEDVSMTKPSGEIVPYTCPTNNAGGQWQVPCGVPMAPFVITGMYPMMGSGFRYPVMSFPPLVTPTVPAATSIISARGCSIPSSPLQYSSCHLPLSAAASVVPLYMSPVVGRLVQPGSSTSHANLMPFMTSLPHAVHNQQSSTALRLVLRPAMPLPEHLYAVNCTLPAQQQVNLSLSQSAACCLCCIVVVVLFEL